MLATDFNCDDVAKEVRGKGREIKLNKRGHLLKSILIIKDKAVMTSQPL